MSQSFTFIDVAGNQAQYTSQRRTQTAVLAVSINDPPTPTALGSSPELRKAGGRPDSTFEGLNAGQ